MMSPSFWERLLSICLNVFVLFGKIGVISLLLPWKRPSSFQQAQALTGTSMQSDKCVTVEKLPLLIAPAPQIFFLPTGLLLIIHLH